MAAWNELVNEIEALPDEKKGEWITQNLDASLRGISKKRKNRNVIFYASAFLQKPTVPQLFLQITHEEINGFMGALFNMDWDAGLTLILHTPGGVTTATEAIVSYLRAKFTSIEVIVPTYAMSAGTMISLASDRILMGRQSQLGPIDPQMPINGSAVSAGSIVAQFEQAKNEITDDNADNRVAHLWAPILQSLGPALLQEAKNALGYSERLVSNWLESGMFSGRGDAKDKADAVAHYFANATEHMNHGRRIDRDEARGQGLIIEDIEDDQELQEYVLTAYHIMTIAFEKTAAVKTIHGSNGRTWLKNA